MKKQVFGRRFKRDSNERKALFSGLISAMILKGNIKTTEEKAKAVRSDLEKLVTRAKKGDSARQILSSHLKPFEVERMISDIAPAFKERNGGYTRIIKTGRRLSDNASIALIQWTENISKMKSQKSEENKKAKPKGSKKVTKTVRKQSKESTKKKVQKSYSKGKK